MSRPTLRQAAQPAVQEHVVTYSDIVSDGGMDPRNKFDHSSERDPEQEPVAWLSDDGSVLFGPGPKGKFTRPLYTTPPHREWQSLTNEELNRIESQARAQDKLNLSFLFLEIQQALKEKNA